MVAVLLGVALGQFDNNKAWYTQYTCAVCHCGNPMCLYTFISHLELTASYWRWQGALGIHSTRNPPCCCLCRTAIDKKIPATKMQARKAQASGEKAKSVACQ